jgi:cold shock CspA family protein
MGSSFIGNRKKEVEKQKQQKKKDKQRRKEERKANGGNSMDDMIAYVDINGNIVDTPPDMTEKKEEIDLDSIEIATPKKVEEDPTLHGVVEFFNEEKGFGFIKDKLTVNKYFFHISNAPDNIKTGNLVTYELERGRKDMVAVNITLEK